MGLEAKSHEKFRQEQAFTVLANKILKKTRKIFEKEIFPEMKKVRPELLQFIELE